MCKRGGSSVQGDVRGDVQGDVQGGGVKEEAGAGGSAVDYRALDYVGLGAGTEYT